MKESQPKGRCSWFLRDAPAVRASVSLATQARDAQAYAATKTHNGDPLAETKSWGGGPEPNLGRSEPAGLHRRGRAPSSEGPSLISQPPPPPTECPLCAQ